MRSLGFTLILGLLAIGVGGIAAWQWIKGNFDSVLGAPATPVGHRLYADFNASDVRFMRISQNGNTATFELGPNGWQALSPWTDRMDPRAAVEIINFTLNLRVEDFAGRDKVDMQEAGLRDSGVNIQLEGAGYRSLAKYKMGRRTPWMATFKDINEPVPTVFIQPRDDNHKDSIYACTGDIGFYFKDNLASLRDHHPFYFNPLTLEKIRIQTIDGDLTLRRPVNDLITGQNPLVEIRNRFLTTDTDRDSLVSPPEWLAMVNYDLTDAAKQQKFDSVDSDHNNLLTPDEFTNAFLGAWRIVKPLDLSTDPVAMKTLLEGLFELQATKLSDRASVSMPATAPGASSHQIALTPFGFLTETILEMMPQIPESTEVMATVNDRPGTIFSLPAKPEGDLLALSELPLTINELRDATLTHLNVKSLRGILIRPANGSDIAVSINPPQRWMVTIDGQTKEANEQRLFSLLKTVTEGRVSAFETDAATDFTPWGLDNPILTLLFVGDNSAAALELRFGTDGKGGYFVNRAGTPAVMRVEKSLVDSIPRKAYEWRHSRLWSIDRLNLMAIERSTVGTPPLMLRYDFTKPDPWTASREDKDLTSALNPSRANYVLDTLEGLSATSWLPEDDAAALNALATPSLTLKVIEHSTDDMGDRTGVIIRQVELAPGSQVANPAFYYGRIKSDPSPFLLDRDTYGKLATEVIEAP